MRRDSRITGRPSGLCRRIAVAAAIVLAVVAYGAWAAAGASARGLQTGFTDSKFQSAPAVRATNLDRARAAGGKIVRLNVVWHNIAPDPPANPTDPADPAYRWISVDRAVRDAAARGFKVMFTVFNAPRWAQGPNPAPGAGPGAWEPNPHAYGDFAKALAARYSGSFHDRHGALLPHVGVFEAWNEPNQNVYLAPQWTAGNKPNGPTLYRHLLNALYAGVKSVQPKATVVGGATSPYGDPPGGDRMIPKTFLTRLFCLNGKLRPTKCSEKPHLNVLSHHPINTSGGPDRRPGVAGDIVPHNFGQVGKILRAAERAKHVAPKGHHGLWATEFWWISSPPVPPGSPFREVSPVAQAKEIELTLYLLWKQGASVAINYAVGDVDPSVNSFTGTGVYFPDGKAKPSRTTFRFPFVTHRGAHRAVVAWGKAPRSGKLKIQKLRGSSWHTLKTRSVHAGQVFVAKLGRHAGGKLRGSVAGVSSLAWHQR
jgi:hypothetical protein